MKKIVKNFALWTVLVMSLTLAGINYVHASQDYSKPPIVLQTKDVVANGLLKGEHYTIKNQAVNDGLINTYVLDTDYGPLTVESTAELMMRIDELNAISRMEEMDRKKVFGESLWKGVKAPFTLVVDLVKEPIDTGKAIGKGTGQFFSSVGRSIVSDDPDQDNVLKVAVGYDAAKRQFAYELGIDPYTSYEPVRDKLGQIARAAVAGGLTPRVAMAAIDSGVTTAMSISGTAKNMKELVRDNPPGALEKINRKKLEEMGVDTALIEAFLDNYAYNPQEKTLLVGELETMHGVKGRNLFIARADSAADESVALNNRLTAQMMAAYHVAVKPIENIQLIEGSPFLYTEDGRLVLLVDVDLVFWTKGLADKVNKFESSIKKLSNISGKEVWITGTFDKTARKAFKTRGWQVQENANAILLKKKP